MKAAVTQKMQIKSGIILSYMTIAGNGIVQLLYTPLLLRLLGQSEYGLYTLVGSVVGYLSLCGFGMSGAYLKFYSRYKENGDKDKIAVLNGCFLWLSMIAGVIALTIGTIMVMHADRLFGNGLTQAELIHAKKLMSVLIWNIAISFLNSLVDSFMIAEEQFIIQRGLKLAAVILNPVLCIPLLYSGSDSFALVCVTTGITVVSLIIEAIYCIKREKVVLRKTKIDFGLVKEIGAFSFFIFLNMIIDQVNWSVDKLLLGRYWGTTVVAVYGVAAQLNSLYSQCATAISSVFAPQVNRIYAEKEDASRKANEIFCKVGQIQFLVIMPILGGIIFFGKSFIFLWAGVGYEEAYQCALLLMIPASIPFMQSIGIEIQRAQNKHHVRSIVYFVLTIGNVLLSIPLSKAYGVIGAAAGTAVSFCIGNILFMNFYYHKYLGIDIIAFWKKIGKMLPLLLLPILIGYFCEKNIVVNSWKIMILCCAGYGAAYLGTLVIYLKFVNEKSKAMSQ